MMTRLVMFVMLWIAATRATDARASGVVFEHHIGARTATHDAVLQRLLFELERDRAVVARPAAVRSLLGIAASAPLGGDGDGDRTLAKRIAVGYKAYLEGRYDQAIGQLTATIDEGHANPLRLVWSDEARRAMVDALVGLAASYQRRAAAGDRARALVAMHELIRSFPTRTSLRGDYGPEPDALYREALGALRAQGTGHLVIDTDDPALQIYVDERDQAHGATLDVELLPGTYRVLVTGRAASNRRYDVTVVAGAATRLPLRAVVGQAFLASERWVGFAGIAEDVAVAYARALVQPLGRDTIVLVGDRMWQGAPALVASVFRVADGSLASRHVAVLDAQVDRRIAALARVVQGRGETEDLVAAAPAPAATTTDDDEQEPETTPPAAPRASPRVIQVGGLALAGLVGTVLAVRFGQANDTASRVAELCAVRCSRAQAQPLVDANHSARTKAIVAGTIGGVALAGGAALLLYTHYQPSQRIAVTPRAGGATISYLRRF